MSESTTALEEEVLELYRSPIIGASYNNTFGEENIQSLVEKCRNLDKKKMRVMQGLVVSYSKSPDLATSFVSVGVLHALGMAKDVEEIKVGRYQLAVSTYTSPKGKVYIVETVLDTKTGKVVKRKRIYHTKYKLPYKDRYGKMVHEE